MKDIRSWLPILIALLLIVPASNVDAAPGEADQRELKDIYHTFQVGQIEIRPGVNFPAEYLAAIKEHIGKQLVEAKVFHQVLEAGQEPADPKEPVLRLSCVINGYNPGSRAARYIAYSAGRTEIEARVVFLDGATGRRWMTQELRAQVVGGLFGGKSEDVTKDFAKQIVTRARLMLVMRLPSGNEAPAAITDGSAGDASESPREQHRLSIAVNDLAGSEHKLNEEAAQGYRVTGLLLTGDHTADVEFERSATPPNVYQYRLVRTRLAGNLQKDMNKASEEGFGISPHTLADFQEWAALIMEKPPLPPTTRYSYLVKQTSNVSGAEKEVEKCQNDGYALVEETERNVFDQLLLFQKPTEPAK